MLEANEVRLRYSLWSILGGNLKVDEVTLDSPTIQITQNADKTSNLDPLLKKEENPAPIPPAKPSKPLRLDVKNIALKNVSLRAVQNLKDGSQQTIELSNVNIDLDQFKNGASGKLTLAAGMRMERTQTNAHDSLQAKGSGAVEFALGPDLMPQFVRGKVTHEIVKGDGAFSGFAGERSELDCDVTPTEVKNFSIGFFQSDKPLGALRITGPFDLNKHEGRLNLEIQYIDRQVLNLLGATRGWDFGNSTLNATNLIDIARQGSIIAANGKLLGRQLGIKQGKQSTPPLDLDFSYQVTVNLDDKTALIQMLDLQGKQGTSDLLRGSLDRPMSLTDDQSSLRACAMADRANANASSNCAPIVYAGNCSDVCQRDATGLFYESCTMNGKSFRPLTTRIQPAFQYTCGDGVCQQTESCGDGTTWNSCALDCGPCN